MSSEKFTIQVSGVRESDNSIGALVDLKFNEKGDCTSAMTLVWFPKSICSIALVEKKGEEIWNKYFITAPEWFLIKNNVPYEK